MSHVCFQSCLLCFWDVSRCGPVQGSLIKVQRPPKCAMASLTRSLLVHAFCGTVFFDSLEIFCMVREWSTGDSHLDEREIRRVARERHQVARSLCAHTLVRTHGRTHTLLFLPGGCSGRCREGEVPWRIGDALRARQGGRGSRAGRGQLLARQGFGGTVRREEPTHCPENMCACIYSTEHSLCLLAPSVANPYF